MRFPLSCLLLVIFTLILSPIARAAGVHREECRMNLTAAVCLTDASQAELGAEFPAGSCTPGAEAYVERLLTYFDEMPSELRPALCSLRRVFIGTGIDGFDFAKALRDSTGAVTGAYIGLNKNYFDEDATTHEIATFREQRRVFGAELAPNQFPENRPDLPEVFYNLRLITAADDGTYYGLIHELGHVVDFYNGITRSGKANGWNAFSWAASAWDPNSFSALPAEMYAHQTQLCWSQACGGSARGFVPASEAGEFYRSVAESGFPTPLAGSDPSEDFAETFTWFVLRRYHHPDYRVVLPNGDGIGMNKVFENPKVARKLSFLRALWEGRALKFVP